MSITKINDRLINSQWVIKSNEIKAIFNNDILLSKYGDQEMVNRYPRPFKSPFAKNNKSCQRKPPESKLLQNYNRRTIADHKIREGCNPETEQIIA